MSKIYTAITGDLVDSRKLPDRQKVQKQLQNILIQVNRRYRQQIAVRFSIILGDEFQGLLFSPQPSYPLIREIQRQIYPVRVKFGVGIGPLATRIMPSTSSMDGVCLLNSRQALLLTKKSRATIVYQSEQTDYDRLINTIILLIDALQSHWQEIHYRRVTLYEQLGSRQAVARKEKVSPQMISKMFQDIHLEEIKKAEETLKLLLNPIRLKLKNQPYKVDKW